MSQICNRICPRIKGSIQYKIPDGEILDGTLPVGKGKLVSAWIELHKDELMADWELASNGQNIFTIDPLK